jgi:hypothetical protein
MCFGTNFINFVLFLASVRSYIVTKAPNAIIRICAFEDGVVDECVGFSWRRAPVFETDQTIQQDFTNLAGGHDGFLNCVRGTILWGLDVHRDNVTVKRMHQLALYSVWILRKEGDA